MCHSRTSISIPENLRGWRRLIINLGLWNLVDGSYPWQTNLERTVKYSISWRILVYQGLGNCLFTKTKTWDTYERKNMAAWNNVVTTIEMMDQLLLGADKEILILNQKKKILIYLCQGKAVRDLKIGVGCVCKNPGKNIPLEKGYL